MKTSYKFILFFIILIWYVGIFFEFTTKINQQLLVLLPFIKKSYSLICHQEHYKLIEINGVKSLVCSRCVGIYFGSLIVSFIYIFKKKLQEPKLKYFLLSTIPLLLDVILTTVKFYNYSKILAFSTGFLFGSYTFLYFYKGLINFFDELKISVK